MSASSGGFSARPWRWLLEGVNLPILLGALALALFATRAGPYDLRLLSIAGINALMVIGFQFIFGYAGAISLAQSCFFGLGAYVTGVLGARYGLDTTITFPLSVLAPGALAMVIAVPVMRLGDNYFSLATLAVSLIIELGIIQWTAVTGGTNGLSDIPPFTLFGVAITRRFDVLLTVWSVVAVGALLAVQLTRGLYGRAFHLMRASQPVASALGIDVARLRFAAMVGSGLYGGAAGAMMAHVVRVVSPELAGLPMMVTCLTMTVLGGQLSVAGGVLGALLITYLREYFRFLEGYTLIAYGSLTLLFLILAPDGLIGILQRLRRIALPAPARPPPIPRSAVPLPRASGVLVAVRDLRLSFGGVVALDGLSLEIGAGAITGLIGPNGSGKTTLLNVLSGLYVPNTGRVEILGVEAAGLPAFRIARAGVARTFQHIHLVDDLSVLDNIALGRAGHVRVGAWRALSAIWRDDGLTEAREAAAAAAELLGVSASVAKRCGTLPYGTRRRVEVARAIASSPTLLLLDEPAAGFNEQEQRDLAGRIRAIAATGITVLVVEHNLPFLLAIVERLVCLDRGRVIADGAPDQVRADPAVVEAYLGHAA